MNAEDKKKILAKVKTFPSMPGAATKLLALLDDSDTTPKQIEDILRYEPGLTANILKLTNSAYFGLPSRVGSIKQAVVLLGWKRVIQLVMTTCVSSMMETSIAGYDMPPGELWRHSIGVSIAAEILIKELNIASAHEVYTAALLHDIGKMVMGSFVSDQLPLIIEKADGGMPFEQAEREVLGTDHAEIGAELLKRWALPDEVIEAVRWHHDVEGAGKVSAAIDTVHVANVLCRMIGIGISGREGLRVEPSRVVTARLGLRPDALEMAASQTLQWIEEMQDILNEG